MDLHAGSALFLCKHREIGLLSDPMPSRLAPSTRCRTDWLIQHSDVYADSRRKARSMAGNRRQYERLVAPR